MLVYNEFKSVMSQRVVVDQLLPIAQRRRRRLGGKRHEPGAPDVDYLYEPSPQEIFKAAAAVRRGADLPRAARIERRVLCRADDRHGHGDEELGGDDRAA